MHNEIHQVMARSFYLDQENFFGFFVALIGAIGPPCCSTLSLKRSDCFAAFLCLSSQMPSLNTTGDSLLPVTVCFAFLDKSQCSLWDQLMSVWLSGSKSSMIPLLLTYLEGLSLKFFLRYTYYLVEPLLYYCWFLLHARICRGRC